MSTDTKALRDALAKGNAWIGQRAEMVRDGVLTVGQSQDVATLRDLLDEVEALRARALAAEARVAALEAAIRPLVKWDTPHHEDCPRGQCFDCDCDEECFAGGDCCCQTHQCAGVGECPAAESAALRALLAGAKEPGDGR